MVKNKLGYISEFAFIPELNEYINMLKLDKSEHTFRSYLGSIDKFFSFIGIKSSTDLNEITSLNVRGYQSELKNNGLKPKSINTHIRNLKAFFSWLIENEYIENNPFNKIKLVKEPKEEQSFMSEDEIKSFLGACKNVSERLMFELYLRLGLRNSEVAKLMRSDIDGDVIQIHGKGSKERSLGLPEYIYKLLVEHLEIRNKKHGDNLDNVFISPNGTQYTDSAILQKFKAIMVRANFSKKRIAELHVHSCRHTWLTDYLQNGGDMRMAQGILGHSSMKITADVYSHLRNSAVINATRNQKIVE